MRAEDILIRIGGEPIVQDYLRGMEEGSEAWRDARRAMLTAISAMRPSGVHPAMAAAEPYLYAQACLLLCRLWADAEDGVDEKIMRQYQQIKHLLAYDGRNVPEEDAGTA